MNVDKMRRASERVIWAEEQRRVFGAFRRMGEDARNPKPLLTPEQTATLREHMRRIRSSLGAS